jgi:hypothetical protein
MSFRVASILIAISLPAVAAAQPGAPPPSGAASPYYQPAPAVGRTAPPPTAVPAVPARVGLELDIGVQAGNLSCESPNGECDEFMEAGGIDVGATYMLRPGIGINGQVWAMGHTRDGWTISQVISTVGVELRPVPILSIQLGVGHAHASLSTDRIGGLTVSSDDAFAVMAGIGLDIVRAPHWAIDIHAKYGQGFYGDENDDGEADVTARNAGLGAGFTYIF